MTVTSSANPLTSVTTADGPVPSSELGIVLPHERILLAGWPHTSRNYFNSICMELSHFASNGGQTIVDLQPYGGPRDPAFARSVAREAGLQLVVATGYLREAFLAAELREATVDALASRLVDDLVTGMEGGPIRAGVIADIEITRRLADTERRTLVAAAMAHRQTGAAIGVRLEIGSAADEYQTVLDILESAGTDMHRVAVFGLVARPDGLRLFDAIAARGCFLGFDLFGQDRRQLMDDLIDVHREVQASSIKGLLDRGLGDRILLSQNIDHIELMWVNGGDGYGHLLRDVAPVVRKYRVDDEHFRALMTENPKTWLASPAQVTADPAPG